MSDVLEFRIIYPFAFWLAELTSKLYRQRLLQLAEIEKSHSLVITAKNSCRILRNYPIDFELFFT